MTFARYRHRLEQHSTETILGWDLWFPEPAKELEGQGPGGPHAPPAFWLPHTDVGGAQGALICSFGLGWHYTRRCYYLAEHS
jgi:hypothetical protein